MMSAAVLLRIYSAVTRIPSQQHHDVMLHMCAAQGFYVLVDYHAYPGDTTVSSGNLVSDWQTLWTAITSLSDYKSTLAGRVFLDLINEPDGINVQ